MIEEATAQLVSKIDLSPSLMEAVMQEIMTGEADTEQIVSFLTALDEKGETAAEITAAVSVMRSHSIKVAVTKDIILDTCGTGGDRKGTFNVSTVVAFVASGCGITVAKHGNRSVSSSCGSADILEYLGVNIAMNTDRLKDCLDKVGIAFLFAQQLHPAMKYAMAARKKIGRRTMFNLLGPLSNPASATHQLIGVFSRHWAPVFTEVLTRLGIVHGIVVHGEDGLDEITTTGRTFISETNRGSISHYEITPQVYGFNTATLEELKGGSIQDNAAILLDILNGKKGPARDIVLLNAAFAIYAADKTATVKEAIQLAMHSIDSGSAKAKLEALKDYSSR